MIEKLNVDRQDVRKSQPGDTCVKALIAVADRKTRCLWILREMETTLGEEPVAREMLHELSSEPLV